MQISLSYFVVKGKTEDSVI